MTQDSRLPGQKRHWRSFGRRAGPGRLQVGWGFAAALASFLATYLGNRTAIYID